MRRRAGAANGQQGFALLAVMLVMALLGVVLAEFAYSMRLEGSMVRAYKESVMAIHLAEAGVHQAIREILGGGTIAALDEDGQVAFYRLPPGQTTMTRIPVLQRSRVPLGPGEFSYRITDEEARTFTVPLSFLPRGRNYVAEIYADGPNAHWLTNPLPVAISRRTVTSASSLRLVLAPGGGQAVRLRPAR